MDHHSRFISEIKVKCELFKIPSSNDSDKENCDKEDTKVINLTMMSFWECNLYENKCIFLKEHFIYIYNIYIYIQYVYIYTYMIIR